MFSGAFSSWLAWPLSGVVAWLGWIAALAILSYRWKGKRSYVVGLALAVAFCVYGGFPEAYFFVAAALLSFFVALAVVALVRRRRLSLSAVVRVGAGIVAGGVVSAPLWFPGLQIITGSHRAAGVGGVRGVDANSLGLLVAPGYYGLPIKGSAWFYSHGDYYETVVYVGVDRARPGRGRSAALVAPPDGHRPCRHGRGHHGDRLPDAVVPSRVLSVGRTSLHDVAIKRMRAVLGLPVGVLSALGLETLMRARGERRMLITYWALSAAVAVFVGFLWYEALANSLPAAEHRLRLDSLWWPVGLVAACVLAGLLFVLVRKLAHGRLARAALVAAVAVLFGAETAFLVFSGVGINSYSGSFFPVTPAIARLKAVVGSGLIGLDTGDPLPVAKDGRMPASSRKPTSATLSPSSPPTTR